jgi:hypothetical protein
MTDLFNIQSVLRARQLSQKPINVRTGLDGRDWSGSVADDLNNRGGAPYLHFESFRRRQFYWRNSRDLLELSSNGDTASFVLGNDFLHKSIGLSTEVPYVHDLYLAFLSRLRVFHSSQRNRGEVFFEGLTNVCGSKTESGYQSKLYLVRKHLQVLTNSSHLFSANLANQSIYAASQ